jgi:transposase-like protein
LKLLKQLLKKYGAPRSIVTDGLRAYSAAMDEIGVAAYRHEVGGRRNNRAENSHQPFRRRAGDAEVPTHEDASEVPLIPRSNPQSFQSGTASRHEGSL